MKTTFPWVGADLRQLLLALDFAGVGDPSCEVDEAGHVVADDEEERLVHVDLSWKHLGNKL